MRLRTLSTLTAIATLALSCSTMILTYRVIQDCRALAASVYGSHAP